MNKPTVTELLNLLNKPALMKWANKIGLEGVRLEDYRAKSTSAGTSLHKQIENYLLNGIYFEDKEIQSKFEAFQSDKVFAGNEVSIETDYFIGRYDAKIIYKDQSYICDFKSSSNIYLEQKLQLTAYRMAERTDKVAIIEIPNFKFKEVQIKDFSPYEKILINLSEIWSNLRNTNERL